MHLLILLFVFIDVLRQEWVVVLYISLARLTRRLVVLLNLWLVLWNILIRLSSYRRRCDTLVVAVSLYHALAWVLRVRWVHL